MFGRKPKAQLKPPDCIARYVVLKHSQWRGKYKRILCISPTALFTQNPDSNLKVTNTYAIAKDPDIESITIGKAGQEDTEFILTARQDKKSKFKPVKFTCKQRSLLLTDLFQCIASVTAMSSAPIASRVLGSPESFHAVQWAQGSWVPVTLRLTAFSIECLDTDSGAVEWRLDYCIMSAPAVILLSPQPATTDMPAQDGLFALKSSMLGQPPRVFGCRQRDTLVKHMQETALRRLGCGITVDGHGQTSVQQLVTAVVQAERQHAVEPGEVPLGEWEVERLKPRLDVLPPQVMQIVPSMQNRPLPLETIAQPPAAPGFNTVFRRLVITRTSVLERRTDSYDVVERRPLGLVSALIRFLEEPKLLGVEWADGTPPTLYSTPARDAALALLLDSAQVAAQRSIPVLPGFTSPGDTLVGADAQGGHGTRVESDLEMERMYLEQLANRGREAHMVQVHAGFANLGSIDMKQNLDLKLDSAGTTDLDSAASLSPTGSPPGPRKLLQAMTRDRPRKAVNPEVQEASDVLLEGVFEFNACVPYSGVTPTATLDEQAVWAIVALLPDDMRPGATTFLSVDDVKQAVAIIQCLQRLSVSPSICSYMLSAPKLVPRVFAGLASGNDPLVFECARFLTRLWAPSAARVGAGPWRMVRGQVLEDDDNFLYATPEELNMSRAAKTLCFNYSMQAEHSAALLAPLSQETPPSPLTSLAALEALAAVVVEPGSRSSDTSLINTLLQQAAEIGRPLFTLFSHPAGRVADGAAVLMRTIAEHGSDSAAPMREAALREGSILHHLYMAMFALGPKKKLSQELVASWADEHPPALALLRRIFPPGLVRYLNISKQPRRPAVPPPHVPRSFTAPVSSMEANAANLPSAPPPNPTLHPSSSSNSLANAYSSQQLPNGRPTSPLSHRDPAPGASLPPNTAPPSSLPASGVSTPGHVTPPRTPSSAVPPSGPTGAYPQPPATPPLNARASLLSSVSTLGTAPPAVPTGSVSGQEPAAAGAGPKTGAGEAQGASGHGNSEDREGALENGPPSVPARTQPAPQITAGLRGNWDAFWTAISKDHCHAGLIWNETTRQELKEALEKQDMSLRSKRMRVAEGSGGYPSWNYEEFAVTYHSLSKHLCIGGVYVKLLLEGLDTGAVEKVPTPRELFLALYHHLLCVASTELQLERMAHIQARSAAVYALDQQAVASQELCIRAMAAVYQVHAGVIGPFDGIAHLMKVLDLTSSRSLRHNILILLQALLNPRCSDINETAKRSAKLNGYAFVDAGGIELAVDMMVSAHEVTERRPPPTSLPVQTLLITSISHDEMPKEWFYFPDGYFPEGRPTQPSSDPLEAEATPASLGDGTGKVGPVAKHEIKHMYANGTLNMLTPFITSGMMHPKPMFEIRELRWMVAKGSGLFSGFQVAKLVLTLLQQLAGLQPARDSFGHVLQPLPRVHRFLASRQCLPHIAQLMLTSEPELVSRSAALLETVLQHNEEALPLLYQTGVFYFALAYCGSNLLEVAKLFKLAHLRQHFRGTLDTQAGMPLAQRSYLGHLIPESLLYVLETYGAEAFAQGLAGDTDNPELVWTHGMRAQNLIPQLLQHLGDFPYRLMQNSHAVYDYTPLPPLSYLELKEEIWCHRYYLRNLCDEERFKGWPIVDHVPLLQALLAEWRSELTRQPLSMSEAEACQVLGIKPAADGTVTEEEMRRAYRAMARKYHPDKNPEGRHIFLKVQKAYERLQAGSAGGQGPQAWRVLLMLRAQCIVFKHHSEVMRPYKYAGYQQLLEVVQSAAAVETGQDHFLATERVELVQAAVELCWLTCVCCQLNAEELMRCNGIDVLADLLARCVSVLPKDTPPHAPAAVITANVLRTMAGLAAVPQARKEMAIRKRLLVDIIKCCELERAPAAVDATLICIAYMAANPELQNMMVECGVVGYAVPKLLGYDVTLEPEVAEGMVLPFSPTTGPAASFHVLESPLIRPNMAAAKSYHAVLALQALARVAGLLQAPNQTPTCSDAQVALRVLLTESLTIRMGTQDPRQLLVDINSSLETPQAIWNNSMREELLKVMEAHRQEPDIKQLLNFQYKCLSGELVVAGIFIRVYNARPQELRGDASNLCKGLIRYMFDMLVGKFAPFFASTDALNDKERQDLLSVLRALQLLLEAEPRMLGLLASKSAMSPLIACLHPAATRPFDNVDGDLQTQLPESLTPSFEAQLASAALAVLSRLTQNAGCVEALMEEQSVRLMYWLVYNPPSCHCLQAVIHLLHTLAGQTQTAWGAAGQAGVLYLLSVLLHMGRWPWPGGEMPNKNAEDEIKASVSSLLGRLMLQPMHGQRMILILNKLLPPGMVDMMKEGPGEALLKALSETVETPECLWDVHMASATTTEICTLASQARTQQAEGNFDWNLPSSFAMDFDKLRGELYVGGVYVRLFLKNPKYQLRNPKRFAEGLMERYVVELGKGSASDYAVLLSAALVSVLKTHTLLADHVAQLGYIPKLLAALSTRKMAATRNLPTSPVSPQSADGAASSNSQLAPPDEVGGSILRVLHQLSESNVVAEAMAASLSYPAVITFVEAMVWGEGATILVLETLKRLLSINNRQRDLLVGQGLQAGLVPMLLNILDWRRQPGAAPGSEAAAAQQQDSGAQRALAVDVLRLMMLDGTYAAQVSSMLEASEVWHAHRDQLHDLYLPKGAQEAGVVGLLTNSAAAMYALPAPDQLASPPKQMPMYGQQWEG